MELLLNLVWLSLAVPAIWMWHHASVCPLGACRLNRIRPFLLLSCVLVLLFPVISATDDLQAARQEMEESSPSKRMVKQAVSDKSAVGLSVAGALPAWIYPVRFDPNDELCGLVSSMSLVRPRQTHSSERPSRAPPFPSVGARVRFAA